MSDSPLPPALTRDMTADINAGIVTVTRSGWTQKYKMVPLDYFTQEELEAMRALLASDEVPLLYLDEGRPRGEEVECPPLWASVTAKIAALLASHPPEAR